MSAARAGRVGTARRDCLGRASCATRHGTVSSSLGLTLALLLAVPALARAVVPGGGPTSSDCAVVWDGVTATKGATGVACRDGDATCDADGIEDGACTFGVGLCVLADGVDGCTATAVESIKPSRTLLATGTLVTQALGLPALPATAPACGTAALVRLPLRGRSRTKPSRRLKLKAKAVATVGGGSGRDADKLVLQCLPNAGEGECPANPAGGPREIRLVAADAGTDLDNGWTGVAHNFALVGGSTIRGCLAGCDATTSSACTLAGDTGRGTINPTFGPPLPLFVLGAATCLVNEYDGSISGTTDLATGATEVALTLATEVWIAPPGIVCPQCSGAARGDTGVCLDGPDRGRACRVEGTVLVGEAGETFELSSSCRPEGTMAARLKIPLHVTTASRSLAGPLPCDGQLETNGCPGDGACDAACTGDACVAQVEDPVEPGTTRCVDRKGGLAQQCCAADPTLPCFDAGVTVRVGRAAVPAPAWPDPVYPKTSEPVLVDVFCEPATGQNLFDAITTGLPGTSALVLPMHACVRDAEPCP